MRITVDGGWAGDLCVVDWVDGSLELVYGPPAVLDALRERAASEVGLEYSPVGPFFPASLETAHQFVLLAKEVFVDPIFIPDEDEIPVPGSEVPEGAVS